MAKKPTYDAEPPVKSAGFAETAPEWIAKPDATVSDDTRAALKRLGDQNAEALTRLADR